MSEPREFASQAWPDVERRVQGSLVALLPVGSTEAHGPHLPVATDVIIAEGMAVAAARKLEARGHDVTVLPTLPYGVTDCAAEFAGTVTVSAAALTAMLSDVARSLAAQGVKVLCLANAHLEPAHRHVLRAVAETEYPGLQVVFPDKVRGKYAKRLGAEFLSGACHAGSYESSLVLALRPDWVRDDVRQELAENPISLGEALRDGKKTFLEAGGPQAYFGAPAAASREEGERHLEVLADILVEEIEVGVAAMKNLPRAP